MNDIDLYIYSQKQTVLKNSVTNSNRGYIDYLGFLLM